MEHKNHITQQEFWKPKAQNQSQQRERERETKSLTPVTSVYHLISNLLLFSVLFSMNLMKH